MKTLKTAIAAIAVLGFASAAHAQDGQAYVNVGVDTLEFDQYGIGGKLGYQFSDYFGVEAQGSIGIIDDEVTFGGTTVDIGYDYLIGGFATGTLPLGESVDLIGRVGYYAAEVSAEATAGGIGASEDTDGFAFGAGGGTGSKAGSPGTGGGTGGGGGIKPLGAIIIDDKGARVEAIKGAMTNMASVLGEAASRVMSKDTRGAETPSDGS